MASLPPSRERRVASLAVGRLPDYYAVHATTALASIGDDSPAASRGRRLLAAWQAAGLATCDVNIEAG
jgi:hypothetical protein